jgi:hypothetical protein
LLVSTMLTFGCTTSDGDESGENPVDYDGTGLDLSGDHSPSDIDAGDLTEVGDNSSGKDLPTVEESEHECPDLFSTITLSGEGMMTIESGINGLPLYMVGGGLYSASPWNDGELRSAICVHPFFRGIAQADLDEGGSLESGNWNWTVADVSLLLENQAGDAALLIEFMGLRGGTFTSDQIRAGEDSSWPSLRVMYRYPEQFEQAEIMTAFSQGSVSISSNPLVCGEDIEISFEDLEIQSNSGSEPITLNGSLSFPLSMPDDRSMRERLGFIVGGGEGCEDENGVLSNVSSINSDDVLLQLACFTGLGNAVDTGEGPRVFRPDFIVQYGEDVLGEVSAEIVVPRGLSGPQTLDVVVPEDLLGDGTGIYSPGESGFFFALNDDSDGYGGVDYRATSGSLDLVVATSLDSSGFNMDLIGSLDVEMVQVLSCGDTPSLSGEAFQLTGTLSVHPLIGEE